MQIERAPHHPDDDDFYFPLTRRHTQMRRQLPFAFIPRSADAQKEQKEKKNVFLLFRFNFLSTAEFTDGPTLTSIHWLPAFVLALEKLISFCFFCAGPFLFVFCFSFG